MGGGELRLGLRVRWVGSRSVGWCAGNGSSSGELFLARDRMGQKPLYYAYEPEGAFAFASELGALRVLPWVDSTLDVRSLSEYLTWGYSPRGTIYRGAAKLGAGQW